MCLASITFYSKAWTSLKCIQQKWKKVHLGGTKLEDMLLVNKTCFTEYSCRIAVLLLKSVLLGKPLRLCWQRFIVSRRADNDYYLC